MLHILAAVVALTDPSGPVVEARIANVIADPERYDGQTLRFRGQIDACYSWVCSVCPEEMTPGTADDENACAPPSRASLASRRTMTPTGRLSAPPCGGRWRRRSAFLW